MAKIKISSKMTAKQAQNALDKIKKEEERLKLVSKAQKAKEALSKFK